MTQPEQPQNLTPGREVIVVLGVGRSGTSLAMQALETLGVRVSENMIPPNVSNPKGFYEDADIVEIHKHLLNTLTPNPSMPLREGWLNTPDAEQALKKLKEIVETQLIAGEGPWAFKDPRTATFLPLWIKLFNQQKIVPRFVLAIRRPEAVIESFSQQYGNDQKFAELMFLLRTLDALYYTDGNCHLLEYEAWFNEPALVLQHLSDFAFDKTTNVEDKSPPVYKQLNRSDKSRVEVRNTLVRELFGKIADCLKSPSAQDELRVCVNKQREIIAGFRPWVNFSARNKDADAHYLKNIIEARDNNKKIIELNGELEAKNRAIEIYKNVFNDMEIIFILND